METNEETDEEIYAKLLPNPIALVCEWKDNGVWKSVVIQVCTTFGAYCDTLTDMSEYGQSKFLSPITGKVEEEKMVFRELQMMSENPSDLEADLYPNCKFASIPNFNAKRTQINGIVYKFNELQPLFSWVRIPGEIVKEFLEQYEECIARRTDYSSLKLPVPLMRNSDNKSINDVNLNLKETETNAARGIFPVDPDFSIGFIPTLLDEFACGTTPEKVICVSFNRTVVTGDDNVCRSGYRCRVMTSDPKFLGSCQKYLKEEFLANREIDIGECVSYMGVTRLGPPPARGNRGGQRSFDRTADRTGDRNFNRGSGGSSDRTYGRDNTNPNNSNSGFKPRAERGERGNPREPNASFQSSYKSGYKSNQPYSGSNSNSNINRSSNFGSKSGF